MGDVVERKARELCLADGLDPDEDWTASDNYQLGVALPRGEEQRWRTYVRAARAILMRNYENIPPLANTHQP